MERIFIDQMKRTVRLEEIPRRIVSLVPSQTELLFDLGLNDEVIGITKFCIYPKEWFHSKTRVGGTKQLNIERIRELKPDLIIGNKEENTKEDIEQLEAIAPVWMSDIYTKEDALQMIKAVGEMTQTQSLAENLILGITSEFDKLHKASYKFSVLYLIWKDPYFAAGKNTFIDDMITSCGWINACTEERYPEWNEQAQQPEIVFLSSEPYPFKDEHLAEVQQKFPKSKIMLVDGEFFSWYGSRMQMAPNYFQGLIDQLSNQ